MRVKFMESIENVAVQHFTESDDVVFVPIDADTGCPEIVITLHSRSYAIPLCEDAFAHLFDMADGIHMDFSAYVGVRVENLRMEDINRAKMLNDITWSRFKGGVNKDVQQTD